MHQPHRLLGYPAAPDMRPWRWYHRLRSLLLHPSCSSSIRKQLPRCACCLILAGYLNAPILLTDPKTPSNATVSELDRLDVNTIYIIGGTNAVSNNAEKVIQASRPSATITRLAGSTRFDTAYQIYSELTKLG